MIGKKVLETEPISVAEVKDILEGFAQEHELNYEQNISLDHVIKFSKLELEESIKLIGELEEVVKKKYAIKITDMLPEDLADLRLLFAKERVPIKSEDLEQILKIVEKYRTE
ncbi:MAG: RNA polymerase Rpb4 family protein [Methanobacteriaceae archaeon]|nr:RNA polymerase Rpb4 family protein [Methanobacteriaceae archaeon]MDP2836152.1 RNA polymerase Rpb4 family protein [Methanobacteriaceae archaeon]MDP3034276.1 RNA polymerase Rpb4 family protein [Methanobacteriaceae archaeon]MDP3485992.1 RNA polymerase Rpb4 family protein [Methanobacteriaceae archaeon]MDP3624354.1 RNA polymerase Rpb4 family protein [Methanobacteriaceae archaeon]